MAANELQDFNSNGENALSIDKEMQISDSSSNRGGWLTFPYLAGTLIGLTLATAGSMANLVVYLIEKFHVKSIDATQIYNIVNGSTSLLPLLAAIIADSFLGCFSVIWISSLCSLMGMILLILTATVHSLKPKPCETGSSFCAAASSSQFAVLYSGVALASIGQGGTRFTMAALGANQFDKVKDQGTFINGYVVILYASIVTGATVIVYIEDNVSWTLGFGLSAIANVVGIKVFLLGSRCYRQAKVQGSPFTSLARVIIAAIRKRKIPLSSKMEDYYYGHNKDMEIKVSPPTKSLRFLNHAAQKTEGLDGSIAKPWRLCSVQEVEDLKTLMRIFPLLSSGIFLSTPIAVQTSLTVLQALTVDRHLGQHFKVPAGSMIVFVLASTVISLPFIELLVYPLFQKLTHRSPTPLLKVGVGHVFNIVGMAVSALVESKRLKIAQTHHLVDQTNSVVPISVLWLMPQLAVVGFAEAFLYPAQVTLYFQEFPKSLGSTATAMISLIIGIAFCLSTAVIDIIQKTTAWLPDNINKGRLDCVYWTLLVLATLNFSYFLICAKFYKYQNVLEGNDDYNSNH